MLFHFHGDPYLAAVCGIIRPQRVFCRVVIHFHAVARGKFIRFQRRQPFRENFRIHILKRLRHSASARENSPCKFQHRAENKALGHIFFTVIRVGYEIFKAVAAHFFIDIQTENTLHRFAFTLGLMFAPEKRYFLFCIFIRKCFCASHHGKRALFFDSVIHQISSFKRNF